MIRFDEGTGCELSANHTAGAVYTLVDRPRALWVYAITATVWIRFGDATLVGTDVKTVTETTTATDFPVVAGAPPLLVGYPAGSVKLAARATADPGGKLYAIPVW
jgi:hypothetical protein